ncbi:MAG: DUF3866 family protein [Actinobacteria bacterium]|nr:DUF3866 family protein [Actinomycetota bacterium]
MIRIRTGTVLEVLGERPGVQELRVEVDGLRGRAIAYPSLTGPVAAGDRVILNTTAVELGLGTGGHHFVIALEPQPDVDPGDAGHVMKLRYTPLQTKVMTAEEQGSPHHHALAQARSLGGAPVVCAPLHSMLGAVAAGAKAAGAETVVHVMTDGAALPAAYSRQLAELRRAGLVDAVVSVGHAFGGDLEAVNLFSGMLVARIVANADVIVVSDGPGKVGTDTPYGASEVAGGMALNAAHALEGRPVAAIRVSFADPAYRHHGLSPHSVTVLATVALASVHVAVPTLGDPERSMIWHALRDAKLHERHQLVDVTGEPAVALMAERGIRGETMGRTQEEDPSFFLAAGAAGVLAGRMAERDQVWKHIWPSER